MSQRPGIFLVNVNNYVWQCCGSGTFRTGSTFLKQLDPTFLKQLDPTFLKQLDPTSYFHVPYDSQGLVSFVKENRFNLTNKVNNLFCVGNCKNLFYHSILSSLVTWSLVGELQGEGEGGWAGGWQPGPVRIG